MSASTSQPIPHPALAHRQGAVLHRIGGELVQHQGQRLDLRRGQPHRRPGHDRHRRAGARVGLQDALDKRGQVGAILPAECEVMGVRERLEPAEKGIAILLGRVALGPGLAGERLDHGEQVLHPVPKLVEAQLALPLGPSPLGDVAGDLGGAGEPPPGVTDRRDGERDLDQRAVLAPADRLEVVDPLATPDALEDRRHLVLPPRWRQERDRPADHLGGSVAEEALGGAVPAGDDAVEGLAHDRVVGALDERGQERVLQPLRERGSIGANLSCPRAGAPPSRQIAAAIKPVNPIADPAKADPYRWAHERPGATTAC